MSTRIPEQPAAMRKAPRQARSRATVEVIVTAGARVLDCRGWAGFTTNEVASVAGVSIGSLYQYFPNKLALVDAIRRRHFDDVLAVLRRACDGRRSPKRLIEALVGEMIAIHHDYPALHRTLLDLPNPEETRAAFDAFQRAYLDRYAEVVAVYRGNGRRKSDALTAQVVSSVMEGVIHNAARRGVLMQPSLKRELVRVVRAYLDPARLTDAAAP